MDFLARHVPSPGHRLALDDANILSLAARLQSPVWIFDIDNKRVLWANEAALRIWAADSLTELTAREMGQDMSQSVSDRLKQYQQDFIHSDTFFTENWSLYPKGVPTNLKVIHSGVVLPDGRMAMLCEGLEEQKPDTVTLRGAEALMHTSAMITLFDCDGKALYRNPAARAIVGDIAETFRDHFVFPEVYETFIAQLGEEGLARTVAIVHTSEGERWHEISARRCRDAVTGDLAWLVSEVDVSELKRTEAHALHLAFHDVLTGLPNRKYVLEHFHYLLEQAKTVGHHAALILIDLDHFKYVNDSFGHGAGDDLLIEMSKRLQSGIFSGDVVARLGGDEFLVLTTAGDIRPHTDRLTGLLLKLISRPCMIMGNEVSITPSIGVAFFQRDASDISTLMKYADMAMYHAKDLGRNCVAYYHKGFDEAVRVKLTEGSELRAALEKKQFTVYMQPRVDVKTGKISGAEALARWVHPERGLIFPSIFIPVCEEMGLIFELGAQVFEQAALYQAFYEREGHLLNISVNLSAHQIRDPMFLPTVREIMDRTKSNPKYLELEITESSLLDNSPETIDLLNQLRDMGFRLYIDDFGTGYSSLSYLHRYPLSGLKVDRSFINVCPDQRTLASMIIMMSHAMGFNVVAEGVETEEQLEWLRQQDCDEFQGYYFSRPIPADDFARMIGIPVCDDDPAP